MTPIYHHYTKWEDFQNGMYNEEKQGRESRVKKAMQILSDRKLCLKSMNMVVKKWKFCCEQNLSNNIYGHRSFLGQAACNIYAGVHEDETREAWGRITETARREANKIADEVYYNWLNDHEENRQQSLFDEVRQ